MGVYGKFLCSWRAVYKITSRRIEIPAIPETVTGGLLQKNVFLKVCKFHRKTSVLESLFNKVVGLQLYYKNAPTQVFSCEICKIFKNTYFEEHHELLLLKFLHCHWLDISGVISKFSQNWNIQLYQLTVPISSFKSYGKLFSKNILKYFEALTCSLKINTSLWQKNHCSSILSCSSKVRNSMSMSTSASNREQLFHIRNIMDISFFRDRLQILLLILNELMRTN